MKLMRRNGAVSAILVALVWSACSATVMAQALPPLPPAGSSGGGAAAGSGTAPGPAPAAAPPTATPTPPAQGTANAPPPEPPPYANPTPVPPTAAVVVPVREVHAPAYALWIGGRGGLLAFGGGLYINDQASGSKETTGNFVGPGVGLEVDVGARLARRFVPYLGLELGFVPPGHRFENASNPVRAGTSFLGVGFRYVAGDVDTIAFVADLSLGVRIFSVSSSDKGCPMQAGSCTWTARGWEFPRLGLGAEIRINSRFAVSPMLTLSGGQTTDTSGGVLFAPHQGDGQAMPPFTGSGGIPSAAQASYYAVFLGAGAHVDLFGH
jgi:hypothetical protein